MSNDELKEFVGNNLLRIDGRIGKKKPEEWWKKNQAESYLEKIFEVTSFLVDPSWAQRIWHILNDQLEPVICLHQDCSNPVHWDLNVSKYKRYCCRKCAETSNTKKEAFRNTCIERLGVAAPAQSKQVQEKYRENCLAVYGVDHPGKTQKVKDKVKSAFVEKYGVDNPAKVPEVYNKIRATNLERYGTDIPIKNEAVLAKRTTTNIEKYGVSSPTQVPEIREKQIASLQARTGATNAKYIHIPPDLVACLKDRDKFIDLVKDKYRSEILEKTKLCIGTIYKYLKQYNCESLLKRDYNRSMQEENLEMFLINNDVEFETNNREILAPKELDFYLPKYNLAIELGNGYHHSEKFGKHQFYHYNKWLKCKEKGIDLLTYFDVEINSKYKVIKSTILKLTNPSNFVKLTASDLEIRTIDEEDSKLFFNNNHICGYEKHSTCTVGGYYKDKLVGALCLDTKQSHCNIIRFAIDADYTIYDALEKLLEYYIKTYKFSGTVIALADNCYDPGKVYKDCGFEIVEVIGPSFKYSMNGRVRESDTNYIKTYVSEKFNVDIDDENEVDIMKKFGYNRVWDCGSTKWELVV